LGLIEFIYRTLLRREWPLISIRKDETGRPFFRRHPSEISLYISQKELDVFEIEDNKTWHHFLLTSLEHEHLHWLLSKMGGRKLSKKLDAVTRWNVEDKDTVWAFRNTKKYDYE